MHLALVEVTTQVQLRPIVHQHRGSRVVTELHGHCTGEMKLVQRGVLRNHYNSISVIFISVATLNPDPRPVADIVYALVQ